MINPVPQGFVGSNPTSSIESSVRCPTTENLNLGKRHLASDSKYEMSIRAKRTLSENAKSIKGRI